jgi:hypothetical protein
LASLPLSRPHDAVVVVSPRKKYWHSTSTFASPLKISATASGRKFGLEAPVRPR